MKNRKRIISILAGIMAAIMILSLVLSVLPIAHAYSSSEIRKQINALKEDREDIKRQMEELKDQVQSNKDDISEIIAKKNVLDQEIGLLHQDILNINEQISAYSILIADRQEELDAAEGRFHALNEACKTRIRAMEEEGTLSYWAVLFNANSFSDLLDRLNMIEEIASSDTRRLQELSDAAQKVAEVQAELENEKADLESTRQELKASEDSLNQKRAEADELIAQLLAKAAELESLQEELEQADQDILDTIALKEQEYNEAKELEWIAYMATYVPPTTEAPIINVGSSDNSGDNGGGASNTTSTGNGSSITVGSSWMVPCSYNSVSSPFGFREAPTAGASTYHQGVDLRAPAGTPIYASRGGTVTASSYSNSAGYYVTINHGDGFSSIYMHMTSYVVSRGQQVSQGQLIGYVGMTGVATGNHLHFGIMYNGAYVNPCSYVGLY